MEDKVFSSSPALETMVPKCSVASEITGDDVLVRDFVEQEETSVMDSQEKESSKWTNEKHSSYLRSIEASFVDQLYNSLDVLSCQTQNTYCLDAISTWKNHPNECIASGQFKVLRRGCWSKKSFKRQNSHPKDPWIQYFRNGSLKRPCSIATSLRYHVPNSQLGHESDCSNTEVTDQNFEDDTSCSVRTSKISHSSNDQVVPHSNTAATEIPNSYVSLKKQGSSQFPIVAIGNKSTQMRGDIDDHLYVLDPCRLVRLDNAGCDQKGMMVLKAQGFNID